MCADSFYFGGVIFIINKGFTTGDIKVLVASDIAARGLDIKGLTHIFNLDLPEDPKGYLHRIGRTGRMGAAGTAVSIVTEREVPFLRRCERDLGIKITQKVIYKGAIVDLAKRRPMAIKASDQ